MSDWTYLDNNATTQPLDEVVDAMTPFLRDRYANPSSVHRFGQDVRHQIERSREMVATLLGASPKEIVFTSGGTESVNLAIRGLLQSCDKRRLITSAVEHSSVRNLADRLRGEGVDVVEIQVDRDGQLDIDALAAELTDETSLISVMAANNETGVLFDIESVAKLCAERSVPLHVDAVQAIGKVPIDVSKLPVTLLSLSGHKIHGPKGVGALFVRRRTRLAPMLIGGQQERGLRAGTENVAGIVGLGVAAEVARNRTPDEVAEVAQLRDRLERGILDLFENATANGAGASRIANTTNISFAGLEAEAILILLSNAGICASAGSACSSGSLEPSHVLSAMGLDPAIIHGSVRFSLSQFTTEAEINSVLERLPNVLSRLMAMIHDG